MRGRTFRGAGMAVFLAASCLLPSAAHAAAYVFSVEYDGSSFSLVNGSSNPLSVDLKAGDSFTYDLFASGNSFWKVGDSNMFFFAALIQRDEGTRYVSNFSASALYDGVVQAKSFRSSMSNSQVHIGDALTIGAGRTFDQISFSGTLDGSTAASNVAREIKPFSGAPNASFVKVASAVPEPSTWMMMILGFGAVGYSVRRRSKVRFASAI